MLKNKMVRKRFLSKILFLLALFIVVCVPASFAAVASCSGVTDSKTRYGTINGTCWAYHCATGSITKLGSVSSSYCASCSGVKYAPSGTCGTCEYKCCSDGNWSGCNQECPDPSAACSSSQCWDGSKCANKPSGTGYNGKCYFTYSGCTCNKGSGWNCSKTFQNKEQKGSSVVQGWYSTSGPSGQSSCQPSTKSAYGSGGGTTNADSLCVTEARARGISGTGTLDGSCYIIYTQVNTSNKKILNLTCYTNTKVCE